MMALVKDLLVAILSFVVVVAICNEFFGLCVCATVTPVPLSAFTKRPSRRINESFVGDCYTMYLRNTVVILTYIVFSFFTTLPPRISAATPTMAVI